ESKGLFSQPPSPISPFVGLWRRQKARPASAGTGFAARQAAASVEVCVKARRHAAKQRRKDNGAERLVEQQAVGDRGREGQDHDHSKEMVHGFAPCCSCLLASQRLNPAGAGLMSSLSLERIAPSTRRILAERPADCAAPLLILIA